LRALADLQPEQPPVGAISAPWSDDPALAEAVAALRSAGGIVIQALPGSEREQQEFTCDRELAVDGDGRWIVRNLTQE
jgi:ATP phosphoribosyltransferase regulatory subunit